MSANQENIKIEKISELLKKAPTDDGTFYGSLYDLYFFIEICIFFYHKKSKTPT